MAPEQMKHGSRPGLSRIPSPALAVFLGVLGSQACSLGSLDDLKNGQRGDGAATNGMDASIDRYRTDAPARDGAGVEAGRDDGNGATEADGMDLGAALEGPADRATDDAAGDAIDAPNRGDVGSTGDATLDTRNGDGPGGTMSETLTGADTDRSPVDAPGTGGAPGRGGATGTGGAPGKGGTVGTGGAAGTSGKHDAGASGGSTGSDARVPDAAVPCKGPGRERICWYLGQAGSSCQQTCSSHGQAAPAAAAQVGTTSQGGSVAECAILLGLLGVSETPATARRTDGLGLGCHVLTQDNSSYWLDSPDFSITASGATARLVCGCTQ